MKISERRLIAEALAYEAGQIGLDYFRRLDDLQIEQKGRQDLVSEADRAVERHLRERISLVFPEEGFLGEEFALKIPAANAGLWVVDPIDGTWCFLNGIASWCVSIAFVDANQQTLIGVIFDPNTGEIFSAGKDEGSTLNGKKLLVSSASNLSEGSISIGYSMRATAEQMLPVLEQVIRVGGVYHRHGSGALALAWTAAGRLIGYVEPHMNSWDCLAGLLLIEEAGGWTQDFLADDGLYQGNAVVAGSTSLKPILQKITAHWRTRS